jgi:hypothetical protein
MSRERAFELIRDGVVSLPQDIKAMLRVAEDVDLSDDDRITAAGALLHWMSATNGIPGARGMLAYVDDVIIFRLVLEQLKATSPDVIERQAEHAGSLITELDEWMASIRAYLGEGIAVLERALTEARKLKHKGHAPEECVRSVDSATWLYEEVLAALVDLDLPEDQVSRELKALDTIIKPLQDRVR